jgi:hypothetical protein
MIKIPSPMNVELYWYVVISVHKQYNNKSVDKIGHAGKRGGGGLLLFVYGIKDWILAVSINIILITVLSLYAIHVAFFPLC